MRMYLWSFAVGLSSGVGVVFGTTYFWGKISNPGGGDIYNALIAIISFVTLIVSAYFLMKVISARDKKIVAVVTSLIVALGGLATPLLVWLRLLSKAVSNWGF